MLIELYISIMFCVTVFMWSACVGGQIFPEGV